ncbi:MAG: SOS response-associated peptidase [Fimbriimonadaceae bacterium]|nr:MAG: SOS response-associated peptidase [Fimbriimonadaceae bacterium]
MKLEFNLGSECFGDKNPTDKICIIRPNEMALARWSLIPSWSKEVPGVLMTNARSETLEEKPAYRGLVETNRCLIVVDGFYEWFNKHKTLISREDGTEMYFAGLWDEWQGEKSATIITTAPSEWVSQYQDRMPLILEADEIETWLYGTAEEARALIFARDPDLTAETVNGQQSLF